MNQDKHPGQAERQVPPEGVDPGKDKRDVARRRFLRMGVGGSAALVVTMTHKRAFAGIKKNTVASACISLNGVPDLTGAKHKNALETSAMGTPKNLICRPTDGDTNPVGDPTINNKDSKYVDQYGRKYRIVDDHELDKGFGNLDRTVAGAKNYRLYEKGYCPLVWDSNGLRYDRSAVYYEADGGVLSTGLYNVKAGSGKRCE